MTLKIFRDKKCYFQSNVTGFSMHNDGDVLITIKGSSDFLTHNCEAITFWSISDDWQDDETYVGLVSLDEILHIEEGMCYEK